jgi:hypothetical protein
MPGVMAEGAQMLHLVRAGGTGDEDIHKRASLPGRRKTLTSHLHGFSVNRPHSIKESCRS